MKALSPRRSLLFTLAAVAPALFCPRLCCAAGTNEDATSLPPQRPVQVTLSVELLEVSQIQDHDEKFEIEFYLYLSWQDPRLAFDADQEGRDKRLVPADQIWTPEPELRDDLEVDVQGGRNARVHADGTVTLRQYYRGTMASNFDLHGFPFDRHRLDVPFEAAAGDIDDVLYVAGESSTRKDVTSQAAHVVPHGWNLERISADVSQADYPRLGESYSRYVFHLEVTRDPHFYWWAIVLPLLPIVATSWSVFWMDPKEFSSQVGVGVTAMLTVVAYRITIDSSLPPLSYMTRMDYFLLVCQIWVFGAFLMSVVVHVCHAQDTPSMRTLARGISRYCRWLPPLALLATCVLLAWLPPGMAMTIVACAVLGLVLACRPTPKRISRWLSIVLFPEQVLGGTTSGESDIEPRQAA